MVPPPSRDNRAMFTGLVSGIGRITEVAPLGSGSAHGKRLVVSAPPGWLDDVRPGDSIAVNGACLTATTLDAAAGRFAVDVSAESLSKTCGLDAAGPVNLEKALRAGERLGGHIVAGHVDGIGRVSHFAAVGESWELRIAVPGALSRYLAAKGSITVNGVSLTLNSLRDDVDSTEVSINLIPHTLRHTTLGGLAAGAAVNLEIDLIARYVERIVGACND